MNINFDPSHFAGQALFIAFVLFIVYRRFRRNFGKQRLRPGYLIFRMVLLCVVGVLLLIPTFFSSEFALVTILGLGIGICLALWATNHTRFLKEDSILYYIPHTYAGMVVTALFIGRLAYRVVVLSQSNFAAATADSNPGMRDFGGMSGIYHNPLTRAVFFILIGYYVYYYWYVLHESKHLKDSDMEPTLKSGPGGNIN